MKVSDILKKASNKERGSINQILDKLVPSFVIDKNISLIKKDVPKALYTLLIANKIVKDSTLSFTMKAEDFVNTSIYKLKDVTTYKWDEFLKSVSAEEVFSNKESTKSILNLIKHFIKKNNKMKSEMKNLDFASCFSKLTWWYKISIVSKINPGAFNDIFSSNTKKSINKFTRKEFIRILNIVKDIRNHFSHSTFILDSEFYNKLFFSRYRGVFNKAKHEKEMLSILVYISKFGSLFGVNNFVNTMKNELSKDKSKDIDIKLIDLFKFV